MIKSGFVADPSPIHWWPPSPLGLPLGGESNDLKEGERESKETRLHQTMGTCLLSNQDKLWRDLALKPPPQILPPPWKKKKRRRNNRDERVSAERVCETVTTVYLYERMSVCVRSTWRLIFLLTKATTTGRETPLFEGFLARRASDTNVYVCDKQLL